MWRDVATVTVPAGKTRGTVIREALEQSGVQPIPDGEPLRLRVLDEASAHVVEVRAEQPAPQLRIG